MPYTALANMADPSSANLARRPRFSIQPLEQRIAPSTGLTDLNLSLTMNFTGPMEDVQITVQNIYLIVSHNVIQSSVGGTQVGVVG